MATPAPKIAPLKVDFSGAQEFGPFEDGEYDVIVQDVDLIQPKSADKFAQLKWKLLVDGGENDGRIVTSWSSLSPNAAGFLRDTLTAFGEDPETLRGEFELDPCKYIGAKCRASWPGNPPRTTPRRSTCRSRS
jgi:hypothetical protein